MRQSAGSGPRMVLPWVAAIVRLGQVDVNGSCLQLAVLGVPRQTMARGFSLAWGRRNGPAGPTVPTIGAP